MTIDEAIEKHRKMVETQKILYDACVLKECNKHFLREAEEHEQLAEWLEELKSYRASVFSGDMTQKMLKEQYNKAIDDFVKVLQGKIEKDLANPDLSLECKKCGIWKNYDIKEIAEQLKAGVNGGTD